MIKPRETPIQIPKAEFKKMGYQMVDAIAELLDSMEDRLVTTGESPEEIQKILGTEPLPVNGSNPSALLSRVTDILIQHSLFNGHPRFMGYITSSATPIGILADMLAAGINPNVGGNILSPIATAIERQTISWLAEFIGVDPSYGGILVSGGNMANFTGFLAGRNAKATKSFKEKGIDPNSGKMMFYCPKSTHTWIEKAAILFGHGTDAIRWIPTDAANKMQMDALETAIEDDLNKGNKPIMVIGTAGDVSTGAVDDLKATAAICKKYDLWFHVDGAYGIPAAVIPEIKPLFVGIEEANSIAMDPHKWLYSPLEAGCTLVKNPQHLLDTYSSRPEYYHFNSDLEDSTTNFYEYGLQNSRGFRALKVWLALQQVGRNGYREMIGEDIAIAKALYDQAAAHPELEAITHNLSIATFRYIPKELNFAGQDQEAYLNKLNETLLDELQSGGEVFPSNAIVNGRYCLRCCIVNFRTSKQDVPEIIDIIVREGRRVHEGLWTD